MLETLHTRGVSLVLCTEKISDEVAGWFVEFGIGAVQLVPEEEVERVCLAVGIVPLTSNCAHPSRFLQQSLKHSAMLHDHQVFMRFQSPFQARLSDVV